MSEVQICHFHSRLELIKGRSEPGHPFIRFQPPVIPNHSPKPQTPSTCPTLRFSLRSNLVSFTPNNLLAIGKISIQYKGSQVTLQKFYVWEFFRWWWEKGAAEFSFNSARWRDMDIELQIVVSKAIKLGP